MKITQKTIFFTVIIILVLGAIATFAIRGTSSNKGVNYDSLATCLKDKGANFYGAFWCPHCQDQKKEFGSSSKLLPYVECAKPDSSQNQTCQDKQIVGYPTWVFPNEIVLESVDAPHKCTDAVDESTLCKNNYNQYYGVWDFKNTSIPPIGSFSEPTNKGNVWTFVPGSRMVGKLSFETLAKQTSCALPVADAPTTTTPVAK